MWALHATPLRAAEISANACKIWLFSRPSVLEAAMPACRVVIGASSLTAKYAKKYKRNRWEEKKAVFAVVKRGLIHFRVFRG